MRFETQVNQSPLEVFKQFDVALFKKLNPWWNIMEIDRFDGVQLNGVTELRVGPFKQKFSTEIVELTGSHFVDVGVSLPFPFTYWKHKHIMMPNLLGNTIGPGTTIVDDIEYDCVPMLKPFVWLYVYAMFRHRQHKYKVIFRNKETL